MRSNCIKNWRFSTILAFILILVPGLAFSAKSQPMQDLEEERWFEVELIIFSHKNGQALESEKWPEITDFVLPEQLVELSQPIPESPEEPKPKVDEQSLIFEQVNTDVNLSIEEPISMPVAFVMLNNEELQLKESFKKLSRSSNFEPLLHVAWRQPTFDIEHTQSVLLYEGMTEPEVATSNKTNPKDVSARIDSSDEPMNPRFAGTIRLSVSRYLHFAADLVYRTPVTQHMAIAMSSQELWNDTPYQILHYPQGPAFQLESWKAMRGFKLKESRRMRSKKIHYLDHPFLGIVVLITPVELPKDPEELTADNP